MAEYKDFFSEGTIKHAEGGALLEKFGAPPFSVFDARSGFWQARKATWLALGIKSEIGRGENLLKMSDTVLQPDPKKRAKKGPNKAIPGGGGLGKNSAYKLKTDAGYKSVKELQNRQTASLSNGSLTFKTTIHPYDGQDGGTASASGTSIFDPVLCDLFYNWFVPYGGHILDPYAGGSVRGVVAGRLGYRYTGFDLRPEQVEANREQGKALCSPRKLRRGEVPPQVPKWIEGDSLGLDKHIKPESVDAVFSCPPYLWLERYSDDPRDLSTMDLDGFIDVYSQTIAKAAEALKDDRFACFVVGEVRDKDGYCTAFSDITNTCFEAAGLRLYNRAALITAVGSLSIRAARIFNAASKLGNAHQEVLIYVKGDPKKATRAIEEADKKRDHDSQR
jgi:DNA modification methylase